MRTIQVYEMRLDKMQGFIAAVGRIFLSFIFLVSACLKIMDPATTTAMMAAKGMPQIPVFLMIAVLIELCGGLSLLTGVLARACSVMLIFYLIPVTFIMHNFWAVPADQVLLQVTMVLKNLAIMGGLFMVAAFGPGPVVIESIKPIAHSEVIDAPEDKEVTTMGPTTTEVVPPQAIVRQSTTLKK